MDDMQRFREIKANADPDDPMFADADVEVAADAIARAWGYSDLAEADSVRGEGEGVRAAACAVLDALARTGRHRGKTTTVPR